jgi:hypothetical protein
MRANTSDATAEFQYGTPYRRDEAYRKWQRENEAPTVYSQSKSEPQNFHSDPDNASPVSVESPQPPPPPFPDYSIPRGGTFEQHMERVRSVESPQPETGA